MIAWFKIICYVVIAILAVAVLFTSDYATDIIIKEAVIRPVKQQHEFIADNYKENIWCRYSSTIDRLEKSDIILWSKDQQYKKFQIISRTLLNSSKNDKITLYKDKVEILATNKKELILNSDKNRSFIDKKNGYYGYADNSVEIYDETGGLQKGFYYISNIDISDANCPNIAAGSKIRTITMNIYSHIDPQMKILHEFRLYLIYIIAGLSGIFCLLLYLNFKRTETIINKQHEEKLNLEKAKAEAENQNKEKSMFLANVSHELRTPLNAIIGFSEIIKDEVMGPVGHKQYKEYVNDINNSGIHLLSLINDLLDYSKAEAQKLEVESIDVDLSKIGRSCIRLIEPRANEVKVKLIENINEEHIILKADPKRIKQIILNLLSNAVKFTPENGEIILTIEKNAEKNIIKLIVQDTGIGISAKDLSKAMAPFGQIDNSLSRKYEGTGLGLPLTKKLADIMGGEFFIESEVGMGTTVTIIFDMNKIENREYKED